MEIDYINQFKAQSPAAIIQSMFSEKKQLKIALSLKNGLYVEGFIVDITKEEYQTFVCMRTEEQEVLFFDLQEVSVLRIKHPKKIAVSLSKGNISRPLGEEPISTLQLKRWTLEQELLLEATINLSLEKSVLQEANARLNCKDVIASLLKAKQLIIEDEMGLAAWKEIKTVAITNTEKLQVSKEGNVLKVGVEITKALPKELERLFVEKIEEIL
ncbi:hypothetical protein HER15_12010 [Tenacibaculum mesophilum]|uniref:Uncharacterized protein n=1 Tax=Tenacibaculum mesophilum TaxID=104268 RepID=A0AAE9MR86_9FLAO|nr:hypothetical protein [Tenacibaculum mesophilum]UTD16150.1 hypothetical protein HER15_12010 [Tenacibaculum mesophilum]